MNGPGVCDNTVTQRVVTSALGNACVVTHTVSLSWSASTSPSVIGYNVYRSTTAGGPYTKLTATPLTVTTYVDYNVTAGQTYFYVTTGLDVSANESAPSNEVSATIPTP